MEILIMVLHLSFSWMTCIESFKKKKKKMLVESHDFISMVAAR
jgi:hypothetical protein